MFKFNYFDLEFLPVLVLPHPLANADFSLILLSCHKQAGRKFV
jgi:hypothetical protein